MEHYIELPLNREKAAELRCGDSVYLTGSIYTGRDAAHKRIYDSIKRGGALPFPLEDAVIYYVGPTPPKPGQVIGSAGPTTSYRMDAYAPRLLDLGLRGMIGKGRRSEEVRDAIRRNGSVYFAAIGGAGALLSRCIKRAEVIAFSDLGTEAVRRLEVERLPLVVAIDAAGESLYEKGPRAYLDSLK